MVGRDGGWPRYGHPSGHCMKHFYQTMSSYLPVQLTKKDFCQKVNSLARALEFKVDAAAENVEEANSWNVILV